VAVSELDTRVEKQDPEFIRNGGFGKHFPTCKGAGDTTIVRTCKHPRRITADYIGKHECHGRRDRAIGNGEGGGLLGMPSPFRRQPCRHLLCQEGAHGPRSALHPEEEGATRM
jgi:hypothetical protein